MRQILVMEGNTIARQKQAAELGIRSASEIYCQSIREHFPDISIDVIHAADRGQFLPKNIQLSDYDGLVIGGSGLHAYDTAFEVTNQIDLIKSYSKTGKPILGSCWGLQLSAIAGGGAVGLSPNGREVGIARKIFLNEAGRSHPYFDGKPQAFDAPCIHYDEVTSLPSGSTILCSNDHTHIQGAILPVGKSEVWAVQYHPEFDILHLAGLYALYANDMVEQGFFQSEEEAEVYKDNLVSLGADPTNSALRWQLGIDDDILVDTVRRAEIINWIEHQVIV